MDHSSCTFQFPTFLVFQTQMSPIFPWVSSYQPWPGIASGLPRKARASRRGERVERLQRADAACAAGVRHRGVEELSVDGVVVSAERLTRAVSAGHQHDGPDGRIDEVRACFRVGCRKTVFHRNQMLKTMRHSAPSLVEPGRRRVEGQMTLLTTFPHVGIARLRHHTQQARWMQLAGEDVSEGHIRLTAVARFAGSLQARPGMS